MKKPHSQTVIAIILFFVFLLVAAGLAAALAMVFSPVKVTVEQDKYTLSFLFYNESADFTEIEEITLLEDTYTSDRVKSYGGISKQFGTYRSEEYGEHFRLTFSENTHNYIVIKKKDGSVTVFNQKTKDATTALYEKLRGAIS